MGSLKDLLTEEQIRELKGFELEYIDDQDTEEEVKSQLSPSQLKALEAYGKAYREQNNYKD